MIELPTAAEVREMAPLQRAQHFLSMRKETCQKTIHNLRSLGWDYMDAVERADEIEAKAFEMWEAALMPQEPTDD